MSPAEPGPALSHVEKLVRYGALSFLFTAVTIVGLALLVGLINFPAGWSNFLIVAVCIPPNFELSRRWVWAAGGGKWWDSPQVLPFAAMSILALGVSTLAAHEAGISVAHWSHPRRAVAVEVASFASFGILWIVQYLILDRYLFRARPRP